MYDIDTYDVSLRKDVLEGKITLYEAAVELHVSGWKPYMMLNGRKRG